MPDTGCLGLVHWDNPEGWYGTTQRDGMGREEGGGSEWGAHVYLWQIHFDIWQNQYNIVKLKNKIKKNKTPTFNFIDFFLLFSSLLHLFLL